jgi:RNA polymerase sigma-70 factor (ECF subfamily)
VNRLDDRDLVARMRRGDSTALEPLIEQHAGRLYRVAVGITGNPCDAEEVVQDAFVTLVRKLDSFEGRAAVGTWLYRVAINGALGKRRARRDVRELSLEDCLPTFLEDGHRAGDRTFLLADWSQDPEDSLAASEARATLERALDALPPDYRAVVLLRDVEELSNDEAAELLGESVGAVKSRLHRARMALREQVTRAVQPTGHGRGAPHRTETAAAPWPAGREPRTRDAASDPQG